MKNTSRFSSLARMLAVAALAIAATACTQIDTGNVGVSKVMGKTSADEISPGWTFTGASSVDEFISKEFVISLQDLKPKAADNLTMNDVDIDVYIQPNPTLIADTIIKYQNDAAKDAKSGHLIAGYNRVSREAKEAVNKSISGFQSNTMHLKRDDLAKAIVTKLQAGLDETDPGKWTVAGVNVVSLVTDPALEASIRAAAQVDQEIARATKQKELATTNAATALETAKGEAAANRVISESLTPQLIRLREIEAQKSFAGAGTHTVIMGQSSGALVNVGK